MLAREPCAMGTADLHLHTALGDGLPEPAEILTYVERSTRLDLIAITEHDSIAAAHTVRNLHARHGGYRFDLISGIEVTTRAGHLLALFVEEPVPSLRSLSATLDAIHRQGGLAVIPHPLSPLTRSLGRRTIEGIIRRRRDGLWFDGIELANPSPAGRLTVARARLLNEQRWHIPETGGSDAHYLPVIGRSYTTFPGHTAGELRAALAAGETGSIAGVHPSLREIGARAILLQSWRALWATPRQIVGRPALAGYRSARSAVIRSRR